MEKIEISAATENMSSRKVCERLHFTLEGIITCNENWMVASSTTLFMARIVQSDKR